MTRYQPDNPSIQPPYGIRPTNPVPVDWYSGPFTGSNIAEAVSRANQSIFPGERFRSMEVRLLVGSDTYKYWYYSGTADSDLTAFSPDTAVFAAGPNGSIQFNDSNSFSGSSNLSFNSASNRLVLGTNTAIAFGDGTTQSTARNFYGVTGATSQRFPKGLSSAGNTGDRLLIATGPSTDPFRNYVRFGNAWFQTGVVGIGQGPQGIQGTAGERGATGSQGERGATGVTGERGATGAQGERGATGVTGERGATGSQGAQGERGATGATGLQGAQGERGATGATGPKGDPGFNGSTGPQFSIQYNNDGQLSGDGGLLFDSGLRKIVLGSDVVLEFGDKSVQRTARNFYGLTGATSSQYPQGVSSTGYTGDRLLIATGPSVDPFRNYVRFGNNWFQTGIVGIGQGPRGETGAAGATGSAGATGATGAGAGMRYDWFSFQDYQDTLTECYPSDSCCAFTNGRIAIIDNDNGSTAQMAGGFPPFPFLAIAGNDILNNNEQGYIESWHQIPELTDSDLVGGVIDVRADDQSKYPRHIAWEVKGRWAIAQGSLICPGKRVYYFGGRLLSGFTGDTSFANSTQLRVNFSRAGVRGHTGTGERGHTGATGERGATGATGPQFFLIDEFSTTVPSVVVKGTSSYDLSGESVSLTYADFAMPVTGGIYLTNPSNGTGFPVYFPTAAMDSVTFSGQTLTAGIGEAVTLRIVVTGQNGSYDVQDHVVTIGNEIRWGTSSLQSLTSGDILTLPNTIAKNDLNNLFTVGMSAGDYIYVSYPSRLGQSLQSINNAAYGGMALQGRFGIPGEPSLTYTNTNGYAEEFYVYRSENSLPSPKLLVRTIPVP